MINHRDKHNFSRATRVFECNFTILYGKFIVCLDSSQVCVQILKLRQDLLYKMIRVLLPFFNKLHMLCVQKVSSENTSKVFHSICNLWGMKVGPGS